MAEPPTDAGSPMHAGSLRQPGPFNLHSTPRSLPQLVIHWGGRPRLLSCPTQPSCQPCLYCDHFMPPQPPHGYPKGCSVCDASGPYPIVSCLPALVHFLPSRGVSCLGAHRREHRTHTTLLQLQPALCRTGVARGTQSGPFWPAPACLAARTLTPPATTRSQLRLPSVAWLFSCCVKPHPWRVAPDRAS
jgi:hypothetical protein